MNADTLITCVTAAVAGYAAMSFLLRADFSCLTKGKAPKQQYHDQPSFVPDDTLAERWFYENLHEDDAALSALRDRTASNEWKKTIRVSSLTDRQIDQYTRQGHLPPRWDGCASTMRPRYLLACDIMPGHEQTPDEPTIADIVGRRRDGTWIFKWDRDA